MMSWLGAALRRSTPVRFGDVWRSGLGSLAGVAATGVAARLMSGDHDLSHPLLVAPIGASAVLLFALPASPLAQPRAVIGGNVLSALIGVACAQFIPEPLIAAPVAVAVSIVLMSLLGCLHPPGASVALMGVIGGSAVSGLGYGFAFVPIGLCSVLMVLTAVAFNNLVGRSYPHRVPNKASPHATADPVPDQRMGYRPADLDLALAQYGELLDVSRDDLDALFRQVELQAHRRLHSEILCCDVMSRDVVTVDVDQSAESALAFLRQHDLRTAPVIDSSRRVVGMVRRAELQAARDKQVEAALDPFVHKVREKMPIEALLPLLSSGAAHEAIVVDENRVLQGIITQTDLLAVLYRAHVVEAVVAGRRAA